MSKVVQSRFSPLETEKYHTRNWYKENWRIDPASFSIPYIEKPNPVFKSRTPMWLYDEGYVKPYLGSTKQKEFEIRSNRMKQAYKDRREKLKQWITELKEKDEVKQILKRLWEIGEEIKELHFEKEACRASDPEYDSNTYWDMGINHCPSCSEKTEQQNKLRNERAELFQKMEEVSGADKKTTQLARRYLREDLSRDGKTD